MFSLEHKLQAYLRNVGWTSLALRGFDGWFSLSAWCSKSLIDSDIKKTAPIAVQRPPRLEGVKKAGPGWPCPGGRGGEVRSAYSNPPVPETLPRKGRRPVSPSVG